MEHMLSLLLGLPTSTSQITLAFQRITNESALGDNVSALVGILAAMILDRISWSRRNKQWSLQAR